MTNYTGTYSKKPYKIRRGINVDPIMQNIVS